MQEGSHESPSKALSILPLKAQPQLMPTGVFSRVLPTLGPRDAERGFWIWAAIKAQSKRDWVWGRGRMYGLTPGAWALHCLCWLLAPAAPSPTVSGFLEVTLLFLAMIERSVTESSGLVDFPSLLLILNFQKQNQPK